MKYYIIFLSLLVLSCTNENKEVDLHEKTETKDIADVKVDTTETVIDNYTTETTFNMEYGWGYQILNNSSLYINQPHIPSIQGNNGFDTEEKAQTTADFMVYKLNNGIFPPTVSPEELDSLGVL